MVEKYSALWLCIVPPPCGQANTVTLELNISSSWPCVLARFVPLDAESLVVIIIDCYYMTISFCLFVFILTELGIDFYLIKENVSDIQFVNALVTSQLFHACW